MKTLSVQQPWASLIVYGIKDVENRTWDTPYRGKILIHASSKKVPKAFIDCLPVEWGNEVLNHIIFDNIPDLQELPTSAIIGYVELEDIVEESNSIWASPEQLYWKLKNAYIFDTPITDVKGKLNLFDYPDIDENNLPSAHKAQIRVPQFNGTALSLPATDESIVDLMNDKESTVLDIELSSHFDMLFDAQDNLKKITEVELVGPTKTFKAKIADSYIFTPQDDDGKEIRLPSLKSQSDDQCIDWQIVKLEIER